MRKQRPINSCEACRKRRIRCDKSRPICGRCAAAKTACHYTTPAGEAGDEFRGARNPETPAIPSTGSTVAPHAPGEASDHVRHEGRLVTEKNGRSTYFGPTFWANTLSSNFYADTSASDVRPFARLASSTDDYVVSNPRIGQYSRNVPRSRPGSNLICKRCGRRYGLQCVLQLLPARSACEKLVDLFFSTVYTLTPILHLSMFANDHDSFWLSGSRHRCSQPVDGSSLEFQPTFVALYFAMMFAALKSSPPTRVQEILGEEMVEAADLYFAATSSLALTGFPRKPSLYTLAGFILVQSQLIREEEFADTPEFIGTAYRVALSMGLHRDPRDYGFSESQAEMRRRLWWHVIHLDVMASTSSGLSPLFIDDLMANTALMSEHQDFEAVQSDPQVDVRYLVATYRYRCTRVMRRIIRCHFDNELQTNAQIKEILRQLDELGSDLHSVIQSLLNLDRQNDREGDVALSDERSRSIPRASDQTWSLAAENQAPAVLAFRSWAAILLHLMLHKAYIILYHPLFRSASRSAHINIRAR